MSARPNPPSVNREYAIAAASMAYNWVITSYAEEAPVFDEDSMHYLCYQQECCPDTDRLHWQGYVELKHNSRKAKVVSVLGGGDIWVQPRGRSSATAARDYCCKDKSAVPRTFKEFGVISKVRYSRGYSEEGNDGPQAIVLDERVKAPSNQALMCDAINNGASYDEITTQFSQAFLRNPGGAKELMYQYRVRTGAADTPKDVRVWWGTTRTGKTWACAKALAEEGLRAYWLKPTTAGKVWFTGYDGEDVIVIDDFEGQMQIEDFLHLTDRYASRHVWETKGGHAKLVHTKVFITSNTDPRTWFVRFPAVKVDAAMARMNTITRMMQFGGGLARPNLPLPPLPAVARDAVYSPMRRLSELPPICPGAPVPLRRTVAFRDQVDSWDRERVDLLNAMPPLSLYDDGFIPAPLEDLGNEADDEDGF